VYVQCILATLLVCFVEGESLLKASFRNGVVLSVAIVIAYAIAGAKRNYSSQQNMVTGILVSCLVQAYASIMLLGSWKVLNRHYVTYGIALIFVYWLQYGKLKITPDCLGEWYFTSATILTIRLTWFVLYTISAISSVGSSILHDSKTYGENKRLSKLTFVFSILMWITSLGLGLSVCELAMSTFVYVESNGNVHYMTATQWGLGQVMAVVLLALQLWDICSYLRESSTYDTIVSRLHNWWTHSGYLGTLKGSWN
jgi:hypothetical protein